MRRAVITGMGIVSCLGNSTSEVLESLRNGRSGITFNDTYRDNGFRSQVSGSVYVDTQVIDRKLRRFMGDSAAFAYLSLQQAIEQAGLSQEQIQSERTGIIAGSGGASSQYQIEAADLLRAKGVRKIGPYMVPRIMTSTVSACLATAAGIRGINYSLSSACATSAHCIGHAVEQIQNGKQDIVFAGGGEEEHWGLTMLFDAMGALSTHFNDEPTHASRPFDNDRDGFVIAGGGGMLVVEELEHARKRGANILAEVVGYGATSDGADMVAPSGEGAERCMRMAMADLGQPVDYINAHGTSTPIGDITELRTLKRLFGDQVPPVSSTKSISGHSLGAAGVQEAIYCLLMLQEQFIAGTANLEQTADEVADIPLPRTAEDARLDLVMSNSFGFGGTNATLVLKKFS